MTNSFSFFILLLCSYSTFSYAPDARLFFINPGSPRAQPDARYNQLVAQLEPGNKVTFSDQSSVRVGERITSNDENPFLTIFEVQDSPGTFLIIPTKFGSRLNRKSGLFVTFRDSIQTVTPELFSKIKTGISELKVIEGESTLVTFTPTDGSTASKMKAAVRTVANTLLEQVLPIADWSPLGCGEIFGAAGANPTHR